MGGMREILKRTLLPQWAFCFRTLPRMDYFIDLVPAVPFVILSIEPEILYVAVIYGLVVRALDAVDDEMSLSSEVKIPILKNFHEHIFDRDWHFPSGSSSNCSVLINRFHLVRKALLELNKSHQEVIKDVIKRTGAEMAKFVDKEIETMDELNEYGHHIAGSIAAAAFTMFDPSRLKDLDSENNLIANSVGSFLQIVDAICDYLEDIDAIPGPRKLWPREIWSKYVKELEDLKWEENSVEAVHCLNEMVMSSLVHVEDCFKYLSALEYNPAMFRICAVLLVKEFGTLALCYNNIDVFKIKVKLRLGLKWKIFKRTRAMSDVYGAFFEFCSLMKSKVDKDDPTAMETLRRLDTIQNICINSGMLNYRNFYIMRSLEGYNPALIAVLSVLLAVVAGLSAHHLIVCKFYGV